MPLNYTTIEIQQAPRSRGILWACAVLAWRRHCLKTKTETNVVILYNHFIQIVYCCSDNEKMLDLYE